MTPTGTCPRLRRVAVVILALLLAPGCGWWAWKGDAAVTEEELASEEATDNSGEDSTDDTSASDDESTPPDGSQGQADDSTASTDEEGTTPSDGQAECETASDCDLGQTCVGGACVEDEVTHDDLRGLVVDAASGESIDFDEPLEVGDTLELSAPDLQPASTRQLGSDCFCTWTVDPVAAGTFANANDCDTRFSVAGAGQLTISVAVTCDGQTVLYSQDAVVEGEESSTACDTDDDCPADETCSNGQCAAAVTPDCSTDDECPDGEVCEGGTCTPDNPVTCTTDDECTPPQVCEGGVCSTESLSDPSLELFDKQTRSPYVVRFDMRLEDGDGNAIVEGVTEDHLRVYEDDVRIDLTETNKFVTAAPHLPLGVVLVLDYTNSMRTVGAIQPMRAAAEAFIRSEHFTGTHNVGVVEFHDRGDVAGGFGVAGELTPADDLGKDELVRNLPDEDSVESGMTRVWDAVALGAQLLTEQERQQGEVRAIVFLTDGRDTSSTQLPDTLGALALEGGINLYPIGFGNVGERESTLRSMAEETGGQYFAAADSAALADTFADIAQELRGQWSLTYVTPRNTGTVQVRVEFDWGGGTASLEESFEADGLAGETHQAVIEVADRNYDSATNRTEFSLRAAYVPRHVDRFRFVFAHDTAIFNLQDTGGLTSPSGGWSATPLGAGVYDLVGLDSLEYGAFGNIGSASVPGNVPVLQVSHDNTVFAGLAQPKLVAFEGETWAPGYELNLTVEPAGAGSIGIVPYASDYGHGEQVTLRAVVGSTPFARWTGDVESTQSSVVITMNGDMSITAVFAESSE